MRGSVNSSQWWQDDSTWCKEPVRVIMGLPDPRFCCYMRRGISLKLTELLRNLLPESRPSNLLDSSYAEAIRGGFWTGAKDEGVCLARCRGVVNMIDEILSMGLESKGPNGKYFDRYSTGEGPCWWGPVGFAVESDGRLTGLDGHHRTAICYLIGLLFPAHVFAIHPDSPWQP